MEFLVRGITDYEEPGIFMAFEESTRRVDAERPLSRLRPQQTRQAEKLVLDFVRVERSEIEETVEYDLEGLFIRLNAAIESIGAKRVELDTIEALFSGLQIEGILRAELRCLFRWLKDKGVTAILLC
jgi:circadian clock protein KaiC